MKSGQTLVIVAAEQDLRLFRHAVSGEPLAEITHLKADDFDDVAVDFPQGRGRAQGGHAGGGGSAHSLNDAHPPAELERGRFARHAAQAVAAEWKAGGYTRAILVAGPKMLGALRDDLPEAVRNGITQEVGKDLIKLSPRDIAEHLGDAL